MTTETKNLANAADWENQPSAEDILSQLDRILASPDFARFSVEGPASESVVDAALPVTGVVRQPK